MKADRRLLDRLAAQGKLKAGELSALAKPKSDDALALEQLFREVGFPAWAGGDTPEHAFAKPERRWRFDYAWPDFKLAVELEGGIWAGRGRGGRPCPVCRQVPQKRGRHNDAQGFVADLDKYNEAAILGWTVLRFTNNQIRDGRALDVLSRTFHLIREGEL